MFFYCVAVGTGCMLEKYLQYFSLPQLLPFFFASISNAVGAVEKGYAFFFGRGADAAIFLKIIFFFLLAALLLLLVQVLLTTSVLKQRELPATVSSFYVSVVYTAMLRTSVAAVVVGCFYFCPLDCDASIMVVDCAAVDTGCMLE